MFFVLSGFLITTLLLREQQQRGTIDLPRFYWRRSLRIFPLYYGLLAALALGLSLLRPDAPLTHRFFERLPFDLTYTANWLADTTLWAITWSLATEEQFYVAWPVLLNTARRWALPLIGLFLLVNQAVNFGLAEAWWPQWLVTGRERLDILQATYTPLCLGVLLAWVLDQPRGFARLQKIVDRPVILPAGLTVVIALAGCCTELSGWPRLSVQLAMTAMFAACVVREDHAWASWMHWRPLVWLGTISYGMYLFHPLILHVVKSMTRQSGWATPGVLFVGCLVLTAIVAEGSFRFYESRFLRLKDRWPLFRRGLRDSVVYCMAVSATGQPPLKGPG
jgi:peptidoglycan/LPS O-acetylase OafA/YrhL